MARKKFVRFLIRKHNSAFSNTQITVYAKKFLITLRSLCMYDLVYIVYIVYAGGFIVDSTSFESWFKCVRLQLNFKVVFSRTKRREIRINTVTWTYFSSVNRSIFVSAIIFVRLRYRCSRGRIRILFELTPCKFG